VATANLSKRFLAEGIYVALIQEPWVLKGKIMGLGEAGGKLIYCKSTQTPRTCILLRKNLTVLPILELCSRDLTAVKVQLHKGSTSGYLPYDESTPPPSEEVQQLLQYSTRCGSPGIAWDVMLMPITRSGAVQTPIKEVSHYLVL
jgi:hypothetical protein